jgi:hypothetical protein
VLRLAIRHYPHFHPGLCRDHSGCRRRGGQECVVERGDQRGRWLLPGGNHRKKAEQLFLSPHTTDSHLRHIFGKLRIRSRAELAQSATGRARESLSAGSRLSGSCGLTRAAAATGASRGTRPEHFKIH